MMGEGQINPSTFVESLPQGKAPDGFGEHMENRLVEKILPPNVRF